MTVFPLFDGAGANAAYLLSDEALAAGAVTVEELTEGGSVPPLVVNNQADSLVLFLEGEELHGAKQNRVLNTSVLVGAKTKTAIPVSCVEQGRWRYTSASFGHSGSHSSPKLRHILKESVSRSAKEGRGHGSDQGGVWKEVSRQMEALGAASPTGAMADTYKRSSVPTPRLGGTRRRWSSASRSSTAAWWCSRKVRRPIKGSRRWRPLIP